MSKPYCMEYHICTVIFYGYGNTINTEGERLPGTSVVLEFRSGSRCACGVLVGVMVPEDTAAGSLPQVAAGGK